MKPDHSKAILASLAKQVKPIKKNRRIIAFLPILAEIMADNQSKT